MRIIKYPSKSCADRRPFPPILGEKGITFVEVMITSALLVIVVLATIPLFNLTQSGFTSFESRSAMSDVSQKAISRIQHRLTENKRFFQRSDASQFLSRVSPSGRPAALGGSLLPIIVSTGTLVTSSPTFSKPAVGNSIFFAGVEVPLSIPVGALTYQVDVFRFHYYFLADDSSAKLKGMPRSELWEWHSVPYADYSSLASIAVAADQSAVVSALTGGTSGAGVPLFFAFDPSAALAQDAFYSLGTGVPVKVSSHAITASDKPMLRPRDMVQIIRGSSTGGYKYTVAPNSGNSVSPSASHYVPQFGKASLPPGRFPSGFEVAIVGPPSARQAVVRLVLTAVGSFKGEVISEQIAVVNLRDVY